MTHTQAQPSSTQPKTITGVVERITYQNADTGYTVARLLPDARDDRSDRGRDDGLVTVVGALVGVNIGEALELTGFWQHHTQHGWQFMTQAYRSVLPATAQGIRKYLGSGLIKGIGPKMAERIVSKFDVGTLDILDNAPQRLREVSGMGAKKIERVVAAWQEQKAIKDVMVFLQGHDVSPSLAVRIYKQYADASITIAKNEPYRLAREVNGIGFKTADKIAQAMGYTPDNPERLKAGTLFALSEASDDGHTFLPADELVERAAGLLGISAQRAGEAVAALLADQAAQCERLQPQPDGSHAFIPAVAPSNKRLREPSGAYVTPADAPAVAPSATPSATPLEEQAVYLWPFYHAERNAARHIQRLQSRKPHQALLPEYATVNADAMFGYLETRDGLVLSGKQKEGVLTALRSPVSVLTGGPGTGKTTSMRALIRALQAKNKRVVVAAPTGRAAKRLSDVTGIEAKTLHRLLQIKPGQPAAFDQDSPLEADMVIVDETSMLDILLTNTLLKAVPTGAHLLLVGDADQLPSVGAGNVLADVISSGQVPVVQLDRIFRQSDASAIATNAHRINHGEMPLSGGQIDDFFFFGEDDAEKAGALVVDLVTKRIPAKFSIAPRDIQVLAPMHNGKCGVAFLNETLQAALNPPGEGKPQKQFGSRTFRVGDKVLQMRNNYDLEVFNGDAGVVSAIDLETQVLCVRLEDGRAVDYEFTELDQLALAYAISIHKSQGSEYPAVVIPLVMGHYMMLERKLIYTAVTRARRLAVLVGSRRAMAMAVKNSGANREGRHTGLGIRLRERL